MRKINEGGAGRPIDKRNSTGRIDVQLAVHVAHFWMCCFPNIHPIVLTAVLYLGQHDSTFRAGADGHDRAWKQSDAGVQRLVSRLQHELHLCEW